MPLNTIIITYDPAQTGHKLEGEDASGRLGDLYSYLVNEFNDKRITARVQEVSGFGGVLKMLRAARAQIRKRGYQPPGSLDLAINEIVAVSKMTRGT